MSKTKNALSQLTDEEIEHLIDVCVKDADRHEREANVTRRYDRCDSMRELNEYAKDERLTAAVLRDYVRLRSIESALSISPRKGKWINGSGYEYEYAYCSECGRLQWAGWDSHKQAKENIETFACDYKYCPGCGVEMDGGVYVK